MERGDFFGRFVLAVVRDELKCRIAAGEADGQAGDFMTPAKPGCGHSAPVGTEKLFIFESDCSPLLFLSHRFTGFGKNNPSTSVVILLVTRGKEKAMFCGV